MTSSDKEGEIKCLRCEHYTQCLDSPCRTIGFTADHVRRLTEIRIACTKFKAKELHENYWPIQTSQMQFLFGYMAGYEAAKKEQEAHDESTQRNH